MEYTEDEMVAIHNSKIVLNDFRNFYRERRNLIEEYNELPTPHSPTFEDNKGMAMSQVSKMNDYTFKREIMVKKINIYTEIIDYLTLITLLLPTRQRQIVNVYLQSLSYKEMIEELNEKYYISTSTYKRELPRICLTLSQYIHIEDIPSMETINKEFMEKIK